jgi:hypothetical protein
VQDFDLSAMYADLRVMEGKLKQLLAEMAADKAAAAAADTQQGAADDGAAAEAGEAVDECCFCCGSLWFQTTSVTHRGAAQPASCFMGRGGGVLQAVMQGSAYGMSDHLTA